MCQIIHTLVLIVILKILFTITLQIILDMLLRPGRDVQLKGFMKEGALGAIGSRQKKKGGGKEGKEASSKDEALEGFSNVDNAGRGGITPEQLQAYMMARGQSNKRTKYPLSPAHKQQKHSAVSAKSSAMKHSTCKLLVLHMH